GMQEAQFRVFFERAQRARGVTGEKLLQSLELRLDNLVYRLGFAPSRRSARQMVNHGHIAVNGHKTSIASRVLKSGDKVQVRDQEQARAYATKFMDNAEARGIVKWLALDKANFEGAVLHVPTREEIAPEVSEQLIVELYSK
ncbi:MAG: 30S ribosomal protein S4, partial [Kiritimatiellaeota bacterium]|nr:30S ribosomal protein S4 [Kiritimatiellota bacterium]